MTFINLNDLNDPNTQDFLISATDLTENNLFARGVPRHSEDSEVLADALTGWLYDHADAWLLAKDSDAAIAVIEAFWAANPIWDERYPA